jgi:hypothetical protein
MIKKHDLLLMRCYSQVKHSISDSYMKVKS